MSDRLNIVCPCCATQLVVDREHGEILAEKRPEKTGPDFESMVEKLQKASGEREKAFDQAFDRTRRLEDTLSKKFEEAVKKADELPDEKPQSPFDLD